MAACFDFKTMALLLPHEVASVYKSVFLSFLDPDYLAFLESLKETSEPPASIEAHLEEIEAKKGKIILSMQMNLL